MLYFGFNGPNWNGYTTCCVTPQLKTVISFFVFSNLVLYTKIPSTRKIKRTISIDTLGKKAHTSFDLSEKRDRKTRLVPWRKIAKKTCLALHQNYFFFFSRRDFLGFRWSQNTQSTSKVLCRSHRLGCTPKSAILIWRIFIARSGYQPGCEILNFVQNRNPKIVMSFFCESDVIKNVLQSFWRIFSHFWHVFCQFRDQAEIH